jgi:hypothetical protein
MRNWWWRFRVQLNNWWWQVRYSVKAFLFPLIVIQFIRTLFMPNPFDVLLLFILFLLYLGFLFGYY